MVIKTVSGLELGGAQSTIKIENSISFVSSDEDYLVEFSFIPFLNTGAYFLNAGVLGEADGNDGYLHRIIDAALFRVVPDGGRLLTGIVDFLCVPRIERLVTHEA